MSMRRVLVAVLTAAALGGLGLADAAAAQAAPPRIGWQQCVDHGGYVVNTAPSVYVCRGGPFNSAPITSM
ncbi:hypothetical protein ACWDFL_00610 [Streptomyces bungoensis]